ncbi:hypothetical protein LXL04_029257, partial [Taraxacum kok-saghyz]
MTTTSESTQNAVQLKLFVTTKAYLSRHRSLLPLPTASLSSRLPKDKLLFTHYTLRRSKASWISNLDSFKPVLPSAPIATIRHKTTTYARILCSKTTPPI